jgi:hypothetical protein
MSSQDLAARAPLGHKPAVELLAVGAERQARVGLHEDVLRHHVPARRS